MSSHASMFKRAALGLVIVLLGLAVWLAVRPREEISAEYVRPDGHYRLVLYRRYSPVIGTSPGSGSDEPGRLVLLDRAGHQLREAEVEMVQLVTEVDWEDKSVYVRYFADWPLPD